MSQVVSASSMLGSHVINTDGEEIGVIKDLMFETDQGLIAYAVMHVEDDATDNGKNFTVPYSSINVQTGPDRVVLDVGRGVLESTPGLSKDEI